VRKDPLEEVEVPLLKPQYWGLAILAVFVALIVAFPHGMAVVGVVLALFFFIFLHELAHFVTAKRSDMKVTEFFVGFGPRLWSFKRGETEYGVKALPLGGYCKIIGMTNLEEVAPEDEARAYRAKRFGPKVLVASAGSLTHFALALLLMFVVLSFGGDLPNRYATSTLETVTGPAAAAGLQPGDRLVSINGTRIDERWDRAPDLIRPHIGETITFEVERDGVVRAVDVEPATNIAPLGFAGVNADGGVRIANLDNLRSPYADEVDDGDVVTAVDGEPLTNVAVLADAIERNSGGDVRLTIDVADGDIRNVVVDVPDLSDERWGTREDRVYAQAGLSPETEVPDLSLGTAITKTPRYVWDMGVDSVQALTDRFSPSGISEYFRAVTGDNEDDSDRFVSLVGYPRLASNAVDEGWVTVFGLLIALNVFVGVFNLVPLLPFDGGHVAIATYEKVASTVRRREVHVDVAKLLPVTAVVVGILAVIFLTSVFLDVARPMDNPF
jgi:RIP metalloprotease RseP